MKKNKIPYSQPYSNALATCFSVLIVSLNGIPACPDNTAAALNEGGRGSALNVIDKTSMDS